MRLEVVLRLNQMNIQQTLISLVASLHSLMTMDLLNWQHQHQKNQVTTKTVVIHLKKRLNLFYLNLFLNHQNQIRLNQFPIPTMVPVQKGQWDQRIQTPTVFQMLQNPRLNKWSSGTKVLRCHYLKLNGINVSTTFHNPFLLWQEK